MVTNQGSIFSALFKLKFQEGQIRFCSNRPAKTDVGLEMNENTSVKLIAAILYRSEKEYEQLLPLLKDTYSAVDYQGNFFPFVETDYYEMEMGKGLVRGMISFEQLVHPGCLAEVKHQSRDLEDQFSIDSNRRVNIDIGYMDMFKVVLASFKGRSNKIYLSDDVWADMILYYESGAYKSFMWGFPDFKSGIYDADLMEIRSIYKKQLKLQRKQ